MVELTRPSRPIVHLGYHKTATTWFQDQVWPSATSHDYIPRAVTQRALLSPPGMHFEADEASLVLALAERNRPVLLSEENLSGYPHNGGMHGLIGPEMARRIHAVLPNAQIVIFVRNQREIVRATYAQYVAGGGTWSLRRYLSGKAGRHGALTRAYKAPAFEWEHFAFDRLIAHYDDLFGAKSVHVYPYEWLRQPQEFLIRLRHDLGVDLPAGIETRPRANRSMGRGALLALRIANLFTRQSVVNKTTLVDLPGGQGLRHAAKWLIKRLPSRPLMLPADIEAHIDAFYGQSNARLVERRGLPLAALGYPVADVQEADSGEVPAKDAA
ncbi:MAG: hypothetical protein Q8R44_19010 [Novosphingobium sp.]|nr:hypothetical protein [Novosphingobium sp.]